jgi:uncharacterized ubiquitin-like protein YukD
MRSFRLTVTLITLLFSNTINAQTDTLTVSQNPFQTTTDITLHNLANDTVSLDVYNVTGKVVATYFKAELLIGNKTVTFNADTLPDGPYILKFKKNSKQYSLKLLKTGNQTNLSDYHFSQQSIAIYPNPTADFLNIPHSNSIIQLNLFNAVGTLCYSSSTPQTTLDLTHFKSGHYALHITTDFGIKVYPFIKQ